MNIFIIFLTLVGCFVIVYNIYLALSAVKDYLKRYLKNSKKPYDKY